MVRMSVGYEREPCLLFWVQIYLQALNFKLYSIPFEYDVDSSIKNPFSLPI
jgi:hypothetical protein